MVSKLQMDIMLETAYSIISSENLPSCDIRFRSLISGNRKRMGCCQKTTLANDKGKQYVILVNTIKAKFFEDRNGKFKDAATGKRYSKSAFGEDLTLKEIVNTLAHEIAHLKFWVHDAKHLSYTRYLELIITERIQNSGINVV